MLERPIRVVIVDDHPIVLRGLEQLLGSEPDCLVVGSCQSGREALEIIRTDGRIDVVILDLRMPHFSGFDLLDALASAGSSARPVVLTAALTSHDAAEVARLGAKGLVVKESAPELLLTCVRAVFRGETWFDTVAPASSDANAADAPADRDRLTPRELDILRLVATGCRNRDISRQLSISEGTVKIHLHNMYEKLGVQGRMELLLHAQERRWV